MDKNRIAFQAEAPEEEGPSLKGLKIGNNKSSVNKRTQSKEEFEQRAQEAVGNIQDRNKYAMELAQKFLGLVKDKTLFKNKSPLALDVERELTNKLITFAIEVNNDEAELNNDMGSVALLTLLLKITLLQRDQINELSYKLSQLETNGAKT